MDSLFLHFLHHFYVYLILHYYALVVYLIKKICNNVYCTIFHPPHGAENTSKMVRDDEKFSLEEECTLHMV